MIDKHTSTSSLGEEVVKDDFDFWLHHKEASRGYVVIQKVEGVTIFIWYSQRNEIESTREMERIKDIFSLLYK